MTVKELIKALSEYPEDSEVNLTVVVDTNKLADDDLHGEEGSGIYYVDANPIGVEVSFDNDDCPVILAEDINWDSDYRREAEEIANMAKEQGIINKENKK